MSSQKIVDIPKDFRSARGNLSLELAEKLNVTGEEKHVEEVMKTRGMDIKEGAVAMVASVVNGQVRGMKFVTRGGTFESSILLSQLVKGADAEVSLKLKVELEKLVWPAGGPGMRNISAWLDSSEVSWDMTTPMEEGGVKVLSPQEREEKSVDTIKFCLRGLMIVDCKKALLYLSIIPVAAAEVRGKVMGWEMEISELSEAIPSVPLVRDNYNGARNKYAKTLVVGPLEEKGDNMNVGWLPLLDYGQPEAEGRPIIPSRGDIAREMELFMNKRAGRCSWKKTTEVISELFDGEKAYKDMGITVEAASLKWPAMTAPDQVARAPGEQRVGMSPTRVRRPKYGEVGNYRGEMVRRLSLPARLEVITVELCNASLSRGTWRCYESGERAAMRCERETGMSMAMPWDESKAVAFAADCVSRNLAASTIRQYMVGNVRRLEGGFFFCALLKVAIKNAHRRCGMPLGAWDSFILKAVMRGRSNTEAPRKQKIPMSPALMMIFREKVKFSKMKAGDKAVVWAVAAMLYAGSLRGGEVMGDSEDSFDSDHILMREDVAIKSTRDEEGVSRRFVMARIKNPKELKGIQEVSVEMFGNKTALCPVRAVERAMKHNRSGKPFATLSSGKVLTKARLNTMMKAAFKGVVDYEINTISSHSFRSGLASAMARQGYSDEEIKRQGRWASDAFLRYLKLGRSSRITQQMRLAEAVAEVAEREIEEDVVMRRAMQRRG